MADINRGANREIGEGDEKEQGGLLASPSVAALSSRFNAWESVENEKRAPRARKVAQIRAMQAAMKVGKYGGNLYRGLFSAVKTI